MVILYIVYTYALALKKINKKICSINQLQRQEKIPWSGSLMGQSGGAVPLAGQ
jgi:hypothetical protein